MLWLTIFGVAAWENSWFRAPRVSEAAGLIEEDVHLDSRYLKVMGKGVKERMVSFGVYCQRTLLQY